MGLITLNDENNVKIYIKTNRLHHREHKGETGNKGWVTRGLIGYINVIYTIDCVTVGKIPTVRECVYKRSTYM